MEQKTENEIITENTTGFFTDTKGRLSMRRLLSFLLCLTSIALCVLDLFYIDDWKIAAVNIGLPLAASLLFMFFTSWESIAKVAKGVRGKE